MSALEEAADLVRRRLAARGVATAVLAAPAVPVPEVDPHQRRSRSPPGAAERGVAAALLVEVDRLARAFVPRPGRRAALRQVAHLGQHQRPADARGEALEARPQLVPA